MKNQVVLSGTCLSVRELDNGRIISTMRVARDDGRVNFPKVTFEDVMAQEIKDADLIEGDRLAIKGHMESYRVLVRGEYVYDYKIVVDEFEVDKLGKNIKDRNEFVIEGPLRAVYSKEENNLTILSFDLSEGKKKNSPVVSVFKTLDYQTGDTVFARGGIQTDRKKKNGKTVYYQTCVAVQTHTV